MISRDLDLNINNDRASLSESVTIYMFDRGIKLNITIKNKKFNIGYTSSINVLEDNPEIYKASTIIKSPDGKIFKHPSVRTEILNNKLVIIITKEWTNEASEIGDYEVQVQLFGDGDSRVSLPPFKITVAKPLFPYDDGNKDNVPGYTDNSEYDSAHVGSIPEFKDNSNINDGYYDKTDWLSNMLISREHMNKIEHRLEQLYSGEGIEYTKIDELSTNSKTILGAINELMDLFDGLKLKVETFIGTEIEPPEIEPPGGNDEIIINDIELTVNGIKTLNYVTLSEKINLKAKLVPENTTQPELVWRCLTPEIADINVNGLECEVIKKAQGDVIITCTSASNPLLVKNIYIKFNEVNENDYDVIFYSRNSKSVVINGSIKDEEVQLLQTIINSTGDNDETASYFVYGYSSSDPIETISFNYNVDLLRVIKLDNTELITTSNMFNGCYNLLGVNVDIDVSNVTDTSFMFNGCSSLTSLDVSGWNTVNAINMTSMFNGCSSLTSLDVSGWNTTNVTNMASMFDNCRSLTSLDVSGWNTANVTNMKWMFRSCMLLSELDTSNWRFSKVDTTEGMFNYCYSLHTLPYIDISNAYVVKEMFSECSVLSGTVDSAMYWGRNEFKNHSANGLFIPFSRTNCFKNCINLDNYNEIPSTWGGGYIIPESIIIENVTSPITTSENTLTLTAKVTPANSVIDDLVLTDKNNFANIKIVGTEVTEEACILSLEITKTASAGQTIINVTSKTDNVVNYDILAIEFIYEESGKDLLILEPSNLGREYRIGDTVSITAASASGSSIGTLNWTNTNNGIAKLTSTSMDTQTGFLSISKSGNTTVNVESSNATGTVDIEIPRRLTIVCHPSLSEYESIVMNNGTTEMDIKKNITYYPLNSNLNESYSGCDIYSTTLISANASLKFDNNTDYSDSYNVKNILLVEGIENVYNLNSAFMNCINLEYINASGWNTSNVYDMSYMFGGCNILKNIEGISDWDVSNVEDMKYMFYACDLLTELHIENWALNDNVVVTSIFGDEAWPSNINKIYCNNTTTIDKIAGELPNNQNGVLYTNAYVSSTAQIALQRKGWRYEDI